MKHIESWEEWCALYHRLDAWEDEICLICAEQGIVVQHLAETYPGTNAVFFVNDDTVLKIYCPLRDNFSEVELRLHTGVLAGQRHYAQVRFHGLSPSGYEYVAFTRLPGVPVRELAGALLPEAAVCDLAHAIATLQQQTLERDAAGKLHCLVHYDLTTDHLFVDEQGGLAGIIDFGDAITGRPVDELPALFVAGLQCDDTRIALFRDAYHAAASHYRICDDDLIAAMHHNRYYREIHACLERYDTRFAQDLLARL